MVKAHVFRDAGVPCPECGETLSAVFDSRPVQSPAERIASTVRRRRRCGVCGERYNTYEMPVAFFERNDVEVRRELVAKMIAQLSAELIADDR